MSDSSARGGGVSYVVRSLASNLSAPLRRCHGWREGARDKTFLLRAEIEYLRISYP